jgi:hypothetical protein
MADLFPAAMMRGFAEGTRYYGILLDHLEVAIINRFCYMAPRPAGAPKSAKGPPPKLLFKLLQHVNPELRRRIKRAEEIFPERAWRKELKWWHDEVKPAIGAEARALLADVYGWFTEGFDTADLCEARALLEECGSVR